MIFEVSWMGRDGVSTGEDRGSKLNPNLEHQQRKQSGARLLDSDHPSPRVNQMPAWSWCLALVKRKAQQWIDLSGAVDDYLARFGGGDVVVMWRQNFAKFRFLGEMCRLLSWIG